MQQRSVSRAEGLRSGTNHLSEAALAGEQGGGHALLVHGVDRAVGVEQLAQHGQLHHRGGASDIITHRETARVMHQIMTPLLLQSLGIGCVCLSPGSPQASGA